MTPQYAVAYSDLTGGLFSWRLWLRFGWQDVKRRYRRTVLGPFWTTASLGIFVVSLGLVWANLWHQDPQQYMPYLASGMITWVMVSTMISESCGVFVSAESLVKQMPVNYSLFVLTLIWRNVIVFFHNLLIYFAIMVWAHIPFTSATLLAIPGLALVVINVGWIAILIGILCTRFRDVNQLVASFLQIVMFVTPIFYDKARMGPRMSFATQFNFIFHLVDIVRSPLLGNAPGYLTWVFLSVAAVVGWTVTFYLMALFRRRLTYWL